MTGFFYPDKFFTLFMFIQPRYPHQTTSDADGVSDQRCLNHYYHIVFDVPLSEISSMVDSLHYDFRIVGGNNGNIKVESE
jgi:hypothetical protein